MAVCWVGALTRSSDQKEILKRDGCYPVFNQQNLLSEVEFTGCIYKLYLHCIFRRV